MAVPVDVSLDSAASHLPPRQISLPGGRTQGSEAKKCRKTKGQDAIVWAAGPDRIKALDVPTP